MTLSITVFWKCLRICLMGVGVVTLVAWILKSSILGLFFNYRALWLTRMFLCKLVEILLTRPSKKIVPRHNPLASSMNLRTELHETHTFEVPVINTTNICPLINCHTRLSLIINKTVEVDVKSPSTHYLTFSTLEDVSYIPGRDPSL